MERQKGVRVNGVGIPRIDGQGHGVDREAGARDRRLDLRPGGATIDAFLDGSAVGHCDVEHGWSDGIDEQPAREIRAAEIVRNAPGSMAMQAAGASRPASAARRWAVWGRESALAFWCFSLTIFCKKRFDFDISSNRGISDPLQQTTTTLWPAAVLRACGRQNRWRQ